MAKENKAHTATVNRLAKRYGLAVNEDPPPDLSGDELTIDVETTATLAAGVKRLKGMDGHLFVAVTNREGLREALRLAGRTRVGVMDPYGEIAKQSDPPLSESK